MKLKRKKNQYQTKKAENFKYFPMNFYNLRKITISFVKFSEELEKLLSLGNNQIIAKKNGKLKKKAKTLRRISCLEHEATWQFHSSRSSICHQWPYF